jgi:APA family basic amino acid/polyamine antiporter
MLGVASCIGLMVYLPPASWWRFVGWLVLGMAIYFSYGYHHSAVGRESGRTQTASLHQRLMAVGSFLAAVGLFVIPHNAGPAQLFHELVSNSEGDHTRALVGLSLIGVGLLAIVAGAVGERRETA